MPKQKYNYTKLRLEFIQSDFDEVKGFIADKGLRYNSERAKRTKGWAKEKQAMQEKILARSLEDNIEKRAKEIEIPIETLKKAKYAAVAKVMNLLSKRKDPNNPDKEIEVNLSVADMERVIKIIKTELGEPVNISKNENLNMEKFEGIDIVWVKNDKQ